MRQIMAANKAAVTSLILMCRSLVIMAINCKGQWPESVQHMGHGTVWKPSVSVSYGPIM